MSNSSLASRPAERPSVARNVSWSILGTSIYNLCLWLTLILLARRDPTGALPGQYVLASALCFPITVLYGLQLRQALATDHAPQTESSGLAFTDYWTLRLITLPLIPTTLALLLHFSNYSAETRLVALCLSALKVVEGVTDLLYGVFQRYELFRLVGLSQMARGGVILLAVSIGVFAFDSLPLGLLLAALGLILEVALLELRWLRRIPQLRTEGWSTLLQPHFRPRSLRKVLLLTLPLGTSALIASFTQQMPQYLVEHLLGEHVLGLFGAMYLPVLAAGMLLGASGEALASRVSSLVAGGKLDDLEGVLRRFVTGTLLIGLVVIVLARSFGPTFLGAVYGPSYAAHGDVFVWLVASGALLSVASVLVPALVGLRRFRTVFVLMATLLPVNFAIQYWCIGRWGLIGAGRGLVGFNALATALVVALFWWSYRSTRLRTLEQPN